MQSFVSPTCRGRGIGRIPLVFVLFSEDAHMYSYFNDLIQLEGLMMIL
jgi:hypothetical protein